MRNRLAAGLTAEVSSSCSRAEFVMLACLLQRGHGRTSLRRMLSVLKTLTSNGAVPWLSALDGDRLHILDAAVVT
jgi:hypothetical protein